MNAPSGPRSPQMRTLTSRSAAFVPERGRENQVRRRDAGEDAAGVDRHVRRATRTCRGRSSGARRCPSSRRRRRRSRPGPNTRGTRAPPSPRRSGCRPPQLQLQGPWRQAYHRPVKTLSSFVVALALLTVADAGGRARAAGQAAARRAGGVHGFSAERLARIDAVLQQYVDENRLAGAVALVLRDGQPVYEKAVGWSDKEAGRRMAPTTIFRIASQTKAITSAAVLVLMEEGKLDAQRSGEPLHPDVREHEGGGRERRAAPARAGDRAGEAADHHPRSADAHRRHLVRHRSPRRRAVRGQGPGPGGRLRLVHRRQGRADLRHDGAARDAAVRRAAGRGAGSTATTPTSSAASSRRRAGRRSTRSSRSRITGPLGMKDTQFFLPAEQRDRLAAVYTIGADGKIARAPDGAARAGHLRRRSAQELRGRRRPAVDGARLRALPGDDRATAARSTACASSRRARSR